MMIGPAPMMRMVSMSVRFGMAKFCGAWEAPECGASGKSGGLRPAKTPRRNCRGVWLGNGWRCALWGGLSELCWRNAEDLGGLGLVAAAGLENTFDVALLFLGEEIGEGQQVFQVAQALR